MPTEIILHNKVIDVYLILLIVYFYLLKVILCHLFQ